MERSSIYLPQIISHEQLKISVSLFRETCKFPYKISLLKALPQAIKTKLISNHQTIWRKIISFLFKHRHFHLTETIYQPPNRKKYALAGFTKSTRGLFRVWRGEINLSNLFFYSSCFYFYALPFRKEQMKLNKTKKTTSKSLKSDRLLHSKTPVNNFHFWFRELLMNAYLWELLARRASWKYRYNI